MGSLYLISDIHNDHKSFIKMLKLIEFSDEDRMIIIGDVFDRGEGPLQLFREIRKHDNIVTICGNHDKALCDKLMKHHRGEEVSSGYNSLQLIIDFSSMIEQEQIVDWINSMPCHMEFEYKGIQYYLGHAQTCEQPELQEDEFFLEDRLGVPFWNAGLELERVVCIIGHTPTAQLRKWIGEERTDPDFDPNSIWINGKKNLIDIDCGNGYREYGGRLGCLRLDDMQEYYV